MSDTLTYLNGSFAGKTLPYSFLNEDWVAATLFVLFILNTIAISSSHSFIFSGIRELFKRPTDNALSRKITFTELISRFLLLVNAISVLSLLIYTILSEGTTISFQLFLELSLVTTAFILLKYLILVLVAYVFVPRDLMRKSILSYFRIFMLAGLILYPVVVLKIYLLNGTADHFFNILAVVTIALLFILIAIKLFQIFYIKVLDFFYILLYLCTLEILPYAGLFQVYELLIRNLNF
jgi:hypothetical protein